MTITTKAALAAELNISKSRVSQYCKDGMPVRADGKLDREDALNWVRNSVHSGYHEGKGADRLARMPQPARRPAPPAPVAAPVSSIDGFTPEAHALLAVLWRDGAVILDRFMQAYGVPYVERFKAHGALSLTLGYIGQGLSVGEGAGLHAWDFNVETSLFADADDQLPTEVNSEIEAIDDTLMSNDHTPGSVPHDAIQAGRRARVSR